MRLIKTNWARRHARYLVSSRRLRRARVKTVAPASLTVALLVATMMLSSCGSNNNSNNTQVNDNSLEGNWQFTMAPPPDGSFLGGLQGGFLLETNSTITGSAAYAVSLPLLPYPCNSGSSQVTGTITDQTVSLTAVAGSQTLTLTGTLSFDGTTVVGTYSSTAGTAGDGSACGTVQSGLQWSAVLVPTITGPIQGNFHSTGGPAGLAEQDFLVSGGLFQAANTGASSAVVTGNLTFLNATTNLSDYPCFTSASLSGQVSGNIVNLQIVGPDGSILGGIGELPGSNGVTGVNPVTITSATGGAILNGGGPTYIVGTNSCPQSSGSTLTVGNAGDYGSICLAFGSASACQQPITLTPSALAFPAQVLGTPPTIETITLADASSAVLGSLTLTLANNSGEPNFMETDTCGVNGNPSMGQPFDLISGQPCVITITFAPLQTCALGTPPDQCPSPLTATLAVTSASTDTIFTVPITGMGVSAGAGARVTRVIEHDVIEPGAAGIPSSASNRSFWDEEHNAEVE
jgi:hypothetical protein